MDDLKLLAEEGDVLAQLCYGLMCQHGHGEQAVYAGVEGIPQSKTEAAKWYRKAASQGNAWGKYNLAAITENRDEALTMCRDAAKQGLAEAQVALAKYYETGGIFSSYSLQSKLEIDLIECYRWALLAEKQGHPIATNTNWFDILENKMTPEQICEARRRASRT